MTEPASSPHDEQVRRLLADARHDEPIPPHVAARLDGVLGDLTTERHAPPVPPPPLGPPAPVVDLAARRRRRQGAGLLLAAAAVVAIGVGVGSMIDQGGEDAGGAASSQSRDQSFDRTDPGAAGEGEAAPSAAPTEAEADGLMKMKPLVVSSDTFAADAERYRGTAATTQKPGVQENDERTFACDLASLGPGVHVPVLYDGTEAVLAYRPPTEDSQVVDLLQCGTGDVVRTTTLPVP